MTQVQHIKRHAAKTRQAQWFSRLGMADRGTAIPKAERGGEPSGPTSRHATLSPTNMIQGVRYVHTNLIAKNWRVPASAVEAGTGVPGASLSGVHLRLPGHGPTGPTMEIFTYSEQPVVGAPAAANRPGFAHIAFAVSSVQQARAEVLAAGGRAVGKVVTVNTAAGAQITWCYVTDPEGNIIELQATQ